MERKFDFFDDVIVSGTFTGIGDVKGSIINYSFSKMHRDYFYDVKDASDNRYHVAERFLEKYRVTSDKIIESSREEFRKTHKPEDKAYEPYAIIGSLSAAYDYLLTKFERLETKCKVAVRS